MKKDRTYARLFRLTGIILFLVSAAACERNEYELLDPSSAGKWTLYTTTTGLPGNSIKDVMKDSRGNIWVACYGGGASYFSAGKWTSYTKSNSSILSNNVTCFAETSAGDIIIGTANGLSVRTAAGQWISVQDPYATMNVTTIKVSSNGWIWAGTDGDGFYYYDGTGFNNVYDDYIANVFDIEEDASGNIYFGSFFGLWKYSGTGWSLITTANGLPSNVVTSLYRDSKNRLWIGTYGGSTICYMDSSGKITQIHLMAGNEGSYIRDIYEDRYGDMWFATYLDGLIHYDWNIAVANKQCTGFYEDKVIALTGDKEGDVWCGLFSKGVARYSLPLY